MSFRLFTKTFNKLVDEIRDNFEPNGDKIEDHSFSALHFLFGDDLVQALQVIEKDKVALVSAPSGRQLYRVEGREGQTYTCLKGAFFCTCPSFTKRVIGAQDTCLCKHLIATRIADAINSCIPREESDHEMAQMLTNLMKITVLDQDQDEDEENGQEEPEDVFEEIVEEIPIEVDSPSLSLSSQMSQQ